MRHHFGNWMSIAVERIPLSYNGVASVRGSNARQPPRDGCRKSPDAGYVKKLLVRVGSCIDIDHWRQQFPKAHLRAGSSIRPAEEQINH